MRRKEYHPLRPGHLQKWTFSKVDPFTSKVDHSTFRFVPTTWSMDAGEETGQVHLERGNACGVWMRVRGRFERGVVKGSGTGD